MRPDLADVRLADRVFAPHYAAPLHRTVTVATPLLAGRGAESEMLVRLEPGEAFELLDVTGAAAWGIATARQLVGYVEPGALGPQA